MSLSLSQKFLIFSLVFLTGILAGSFLNFSVTIFIFILILSFLLFWYFKKLFLVSLPLIFILGVCWFSLSNIKSDISISRNNGQSVILEGIITEEVKIFNNSVRFVLGAERVNGQRTSGKVQVVANSYPQYSYGDRLRVSGNLREPEEGLFKEKSYLAKDDIYSVLIFPEIDLISRGNGNPFYGVLFSFKKSFERTIEKGLSEPYASLLKGIIFGESLPKDLKENFIKTGVSHITALSGFNISIIAFFLFFIFDYFMFGRTLAFYLSILFIMLFALMTGASASVIRASFMATLLLVARKIGRPYSAVYALIFAGLIMIIFNPKIIAFDLAFQLSFLATLGLIFLYPDLENKFSKIPDFLKLRQYLSATLAAQIFVLPLLIYKFGGLSLISPLVNILILPMIPIIMILGFLGGFLGLISTFISEIVFMFAYLPLLYIVKISEFFARFPGGFVYLGKLPVVFVILSYLSLFLFLQLKSNQKSKRQIKI